MGLGDEQLQKIRVKIINQNGKALKLNNLVILVFLLMWILLSEFFRIHI